LTGFQWRPGVRFSADQPRNAQVTPLSMQQVSNAINRVDTTPTAPLPSSST